VTGDLYFIHDNNIKSFYGKGGAWMPYATAKVQQRNLCVFASLEEARECLAHNKLAHKVGISILNAKSTRKKLKLKSLDSLIKPNWRRGELFQSDQMKMAVKTKPGQQVVPNRASPTYCSRLDNIDYQDDSTLTIHSDIARKLMDTELINKTLSFVDATKAMLHEWEMRLNSVDEEIRICDLRTSDELHKLEFEENLSDEELIASAKRMQEIRRMRRIAKNEKAVGELVSSCICKK